MSSTTQKPDTAADLRVPLLDLAVQFDVIRDEVLPAITQVVQSQHFILGPEVESLEKEIATYSQCDDAIGVSSGTDALLVALMAAGMKPGDEVITTPYSFFATAGSIVRLGAPPVFVDIDPYTYNIDAGAIESVITDRTRAIIPVHLFGQIADMDTILDISDRRELVVIEDAAQAIGAEYQGRRAGSFGHYGCFSFYPTKNLGAFGDAGIVTTKDGELAEPLRVLRNHGFSPKYHAKILGGNFRLDAIQAAVLRIKLKYLDSWSNERAANAARYRELFAQHDLLSESTPPPAGKVFVPTEAPSRRHIYHQYVIRVAADHRDPLLAWLQQRNIGTEVYYPVPLHLQGCFEDLGYRAGDYPQSERAASETLALPIYAELTEAMQARVVTAIAEYFAQAKP